MSFNRKYTPHFLTSVCDDVDGQGLSLTWKMWAYTDGRCFWEIRRVLLHLHRRRKIVKVSHQINVEKEAWTLFMELLGFRWAQHYRASTRATAHAASRGAEPHGEGSTAPNDEDDEYTRDEHSISTPGLIALLLCTCIFKKIKACQSEARYMLLGLFSVTLPRELCEALPRSEWLATASTKCTLGGTPCCHMAHWIDVQKRSDYLHCVNVVDELRCLSHVAHGCAGACAILNSFILAVAEIVEKKAQNIGDTDATKTKLLEGSCKKKLRVDEDYKVQKMELGASGSGKCSSSSQAIAADREVAHESLGRRWCEQSVARRIAQLWMQNSNGAQLDGVHSVAEDGARLGQPAEETVIYAYWNARHQCSSWLLAQDTSHRIVL